MSNENMSQHICKLHDRSHNYYGMYLVQQRHRHFKWSTTPDYFKKIVYIHVHYTYSESNICNVHMKPTNHGITNCIKAFGIFVLISQINEPRSREGAFSIPYNSQPREVHTTPWCPKHRIYQRKHMRSRIRPHEYLFNRSWAPQTSIGVHDGWFTLSACSLSEVLTWDVLRRYPQLPCTRLCSASKSVRRSIFGHWRHRGVANVQKFCLASLPFLGMPRVIILSTENIYPYGEHVSCSDMVHLAGMDISLRRSGKYRSHSDTGKYHAKRLQCFIYAERRRFDSNARNRSRRGGQAQEELLGDRVPK